MLIEIYLFLGCFGAGLVLGLGYVLTKKVFKRLKNRAGEVSVQFFIAGLGAAGFVALCFFLNDGKFTFFAVCALVIGFLIPLRLDNKKMV